MLTVGLTFLWIYVVKKSPDYIKVGELLVIQHGHARKANRITDILI